MTLLIFSQLLLRARKDPTQSYLHLLSAAVMQLTASARGT